jgi:thymidylate kinase
VIAIDGMPGAGKTTALSRLRNALPNHLVLFPEAQPPEGPLPDAATARYLLSQAQGRLADARRLQQSRPGLLIVSDRCHIGVLAYRYALMATGQGPQQDFDHALELAHQFGLTAPGAHARVLVLLIDPTESVARRRAYAHDERYRLWFDPLFLDAYHHFLAHLDTWLAPESFTTQDVTTTSAWAALLSALPPHLTARLTPTPATAGHPEAP